MIPYLYIEPVLCLHSMTLGPVGLVHIIIFVAGLSGGPCSCSKPWVCFLQREHCIYKLFEPSRGKEKSMQV